MGKKLALSMLLVVSLLFSTYSFSHGAEAIKLKFANYFPPTHMNSVIMGKYCEELKRNWPARWTLTQYAGGTLLAAPKMATGCPPVLRISASQTALTPGAVSR